MMKRNFCGRGIQERSFDILYLFCFHGFGPAPSLSSALVRWSCYASRILKPGWSIIAMRRLRYSDKDMAD